MSKVAFVADVHVGNHRTLGGQYSGRLNERCLETIEILRNASAMAKSENCDSLIVLGDLFDTDDPSPQMVKAVVDALSAGPEDIFLLLGNHEQHSTHPADHALASLDGWDSTQNGNTIQVIADRTVWLDLPCFPKQALFVPFQPGVAEDWFEAEVKKASVFSDGKFVCFHLGVSDSSTERNQPWMMNSHDQIHVNSLQKIMQKYNITHAFAGNWHKHQTWLNDTVIQTGALVPTGWNNPGGDEYYGSLIIFDGESVVRKVIAGPRYKKFQSVAEWRKQDRTNLRARIEADITVAEQVRNELDAAICSDKESGLSVGYAEVTATRKEQAKLVEQVIKEASNSEIGLREYIYKVCSDPPEVEAEVYKYLK
jgi:DNA repair exonuclease SbcCD nuclease subunit